MLEEHRLNKKVHRCAEFDCGNSALNAYLMRQAGQDRRRNVTQVYVLTDSEQPETVIGYYTLSAAQVESDQLSEDEKKKLPTYPIPCFRMGRFAVSATEHGNGFAKLLLGCAVDRCLEAKKQVGAYALIVDAKDESAKSFYGHFGIFPFSDQPQSLYLPLGR